MRRKPYSYIENIAVFLGYPVLEKAYVKNIKAADYVKILCRQIANEELLYLLDISQYLSISMIDLLVLKNNAMFSITLWKKRVYCRQIATTLYEISMDMQELLGKKLRNVLEKMMIGNESIGNLNNVHKSLNALFSANGNMLYSIRNKISAHRDHNSSMQYSIICEINPKDIIQICSKYQVWTEECMALLTEILNIIVSRKEES